MNWAELPFFSSDKFRKILSFLNEERGAGKNVLPPRDLIFNALILTPPQEVKVVILGQDPYPTAKPIIHAQGLAFSVNSEVQPLPRSLQNIFKELKTDLGIERNRGDLTDWAKQGVLLLNTSLTVIEGQPGSHSHIGWDILVNDVIAYINEHLSHIVFILWGNHARKKALRIDQNKHFVIQSAHPSPLSASRGFFGSRPFSQANKYLSKHNMQQIEW